MKISLAFPILLHPIALVLAIPVPPVSQHPNEQQYMQCMGTLNGQLKHQVMIQENTIQCNSIILSHCQQRQLVHPQQNQYLARPVHAVYAGIPDYPVPLQRQQEQYPARPVHTISQQQPQTYSEVSPKEIEPGMVLSIPKVLLTPKPKQLIGQSEYRTVIVIDKDSNSLKVAGISQNQYTLRHWRHVSPYQPQLSGYVSMNPPNEVHIVSMTAKNTR